MLIPTVLIVTKDAESRGGVSNYFRLFFDNFDTDAIKIERAIVGSRAKDFYLRRNRTFAYCRDFAKDLLSIRRRLKENRSIQIVHVNPSMIPVPLVRDGIIVLVSKSFRKKVVVFFRGWDEHTIEVLNRSRLLRWFFCAVFKRADSVILLAREFQDPLLEWGFSHNQLHFSWTMFDGELVEARSGTPNAVPQFLYLGRVTRRKGIFEIIEAASQLKRSQATFRIRFHGHGDTTETIPQLLAHADALGVADRIEVGPFLGEQAKYRALADADVFLLPSYHGEGCPNSVLEAMASGCFIVSTRVAALKEVVQDGVNGLFVRPQDPTDLAEKMRWCLHNMAEVQRLGKLNVEYAFQRFEARTIVAQIADIYDRLLNNGLTSQCGNGRA